MSNDGENTKIAEHDRLCAILKIRLVDTHAATNSVGTSFLPYFAQDTLNMSGDMLEVALLEKVGQKFSSDCSVFEYLLSCYKRAIDVNDGDIAIRLALFSALVLSDTSILSESKLVKSRKAFIRLLCADSKRNICLPPTFVRDMVTDGEEWTTSEWIIDDLFRKVSPPLHKVEVALSTLRGISHFLQHKANARVICSHSSFMVKVDENNLSNGRDCLNLTLFGRILNLSYAGFRNMSKPSRPSRQEIDETLNSFCSASTVLQIRIHQVFQRLLVCGSSYRDHALHYMASVITTNNNRSKMRYDMKRVANDIFFIHFGGLMLLLAKPIIDSDSNKKDRMSLLQLEYCLPHPSDLPPNSRPLLDYGDEVRLGGSLEQLSSVLHTDTLSLPKEYNFVTHVFFMTMRALNIGLVKCLKQLNETLGHLQDRQAMVDRLEQHAQPIDSHIEIMLSRYHQMLDVSWSSVLSLRAQILHKPLLKLVSSLYMKVADWLTSLQKQKHDSLLKLLPEYFASDLIEYFFWIAHLDDSFFKSLSLSALMSFIIAFLPSQTSVITNPHLRGRLPTLLHMLIPKNKSALKTHVFVTHDDLREQLVPALLDIFVEVEFTGRSNQFFEKFQARHCIAELLEFLWQYPVHRAKFHERARGCNESSFDNFMNMLINDAVWLLDESLKNLKTVKEGQELRADVTRWSTLSDSDQSSQDESFRRTENNAKSMLNLANIGIRTLQYLSSDAVIRQIFVSAQFVSRMAEMLDYYVCLLVGPTVQDLHVQNPEKYNFFPGKLLCHIIETFCNLAESDEFMSAVIHDERSFKPRLFAKALRTVTKHNLLSNQESVQTYANTLKRLDDLHMNTMNLDSLLDNPPDHFLDPIMSSLMRDPVILPMSKETVDRPVIQRHLLNNPTDPFNRQPLSLHEVVPNVELKAQIDAWISERVKEHQSTCNSTADTNSASIDE